MYRIFGFTDDCRKFDFTLQSFADVVNWFRQHGAGRVIFTSGLSDAVRQRLIRYEY